jgi:gas vesicle protein
MSENGNGSGNLTGFLMGAVVGAAVGAGVALLLAPRTGEEARKWLAKSTREIKDKAVSAFDQAKETVRREKEVARRDAMEIARAHDLHM